MSATTQQIQNVLRKATTGNFQPLHTLLNQHKVNFADLVYKTSGDSILHVAATIGTPPDLQLILNHYNNVVNYKNKDDKTALHAACQFARSANVQVLVENGADVNAIKRADWTPLMLACAKTKRGESVRIVVVLFENGALPNLVNKDGWSALHLAARDGCGELFRVLVVNGCDLDAVTKNGRTVLHIAALHGNREIVQEILTQKPCSVNVKDNCGNTVLHEAVLGGHVELCKLLIEHGGEVGDKNLVSYGVLHMAASVGCLEMIRFLVGVVKCDVDAVARDGLKPLHCAARKNYTEACELLVKLGADGNAKDDFGRTARDYLNNC